MEQNKINSLDGFAEQLLKEKNITNEDPEVIDSLKTSLVERLEASINALLLENMPADKLEEFNNIVDTGDEEKIHAYCKNNIENLDELVAKALLRFRQTYLGINL